MRIAIVTAHIPPVMGGIEIHCMNLAAVLARRGHRVVLYGSLEPEQDAAMEAEPRGDNLVVKRVPALHLSLLRRPSRFLNLRRRLVADHQKETFDVIHAHQIWPIGVAGARIAAKLGVRLVITEHGSILSDSKAALRRVAIRWAGRRAGAVVTASKELAEVVAAVGVPREKISAVPNAIRPEEFEVKASIEAARRELGIPEAAFVVMTVRRLVPKTGVQYAIKAISRCASEIPGLLLVVVGEGPMRPELERLARSLEVETKVKFVGKVDNARVPFYMVAADLGLFPSLAEATSIAALEFMASGKPVAVSTVGGLPEIVADGVTGFLFDIGYSRSRYDDPGLPEQAIENIADGLRRAAQADLIAMGQVARRRVREEFSWDAYARRLERGFYTSG